MIILTWWEVEELQEHFRNREDIWSYDEDSQVWSRVNREGDLICGLRFIGPSNTGPYRQFKLQAIAFAEDSQVDIYVLNLCTKWSSYGTRMAITDLLINDDGIAMDAQKANLVAIAIGKIEQDPIPDLEKVPFATQGELWPDLNDNTLNTVLTIRKNVRHFVHASTGFSASIRQLGGQIKVSLSIPFRGGSGGVFNYGHLVGFVQPVYSSMEKCLTYCFGESEAFLDVPEGDPIGTDTVPRGEECSQSSTTTEASLTLSSPNSAPEMSSLSESSPSPEALTISTPINPDSSTS